MTGSVNGVHDAGGEEEEEWSQQPPRPPLAAVTMGPGPPLNQLVNSLQPRGHMAASRPLASLPQGRRAGGGGQEDNAMTGNTM